MGPARSSSPCNDLAPPGPSTTDGLWLYPTVPADPRQRELAFRAGVNIVMYALTGNYKADQVHVPALLEGSASETAMASAPMTRFRPFDRSCLWPLIARLARSCGPFWLRSLGSTCAARRSCAIALGAAGTGARQSGA